MEGEPPSWRGDITLTKKDSGTKRKLTTQEYSGNHNSNKMPYSASYNKPSHQNIFGIQKAKVLKNQNGHTIVTKILKFIQQNDTKNFFTNSREKKHIGRSALQRKKHLPIKNGTEPGII